MFVFVPSLNYPVVLNMHIIMVWRSSNNIIAGVSLLKCVACLCFEYNLKCVYNPYMGKITRKI